MAVSPLLQMLLGGGFSGQGSGMGGGVGTPPFVPENPSKPPLSGQGSKKSGGFFDNPSIFLNLLANSGYSTMPQSPLANFGQAALQTQAQQQQIGMSDLQRKLIEAKIGREQRLSESGGDVFGKLTPDKFTPESLAKFQRSQNYGDLVPREEANSHKDVERFKFFQSLPPDQQAAFLKVQRSQPYDNIPGAGYGSPNPVTGEFTPSIPEQTIQAGLGSRASSTAAGTASGKAGAEAALELPKSEIRAETALDTLNKMANHPGLSAAVGLKGPSNLFPGTDAADFKALVDQASGTAFLEAFQELKGGGHITEIEGQKAELAMARIRNRDQSEPAYREAIKDLQDVVRKGIERKRNAAGAQSESKVIDFNDLP